MCTQVQMKLLWAHTPSSKAYTTMPSLSQHPPSLYALPLFMPSLSPCPPSLHALPLSTPSLSSCPPSLYALPLFMPSLSPCTHLDPSLLLPQLQCRPDT